MRKKKVVTCVCVRKVSYFAADERHMGQSNVYFDPQYYYFSVVENPVTQNKSVDRHRTTVLSRSLFLSLGLSHFLYFEIHLDIDDGPEVVS